MAAAPAVQIEQRGTAQAVVDLHALGVRGSDIRKVAAKIRRIYLESNARQFGGRGGWPGLAESTRERKARQGLDPRPERATGALYRSLTSERAGAQLDKREPTELRFGSRLPYAGFQQGTKTQPTRDLINLTAAERRQIDDVISHYVAKAQT